MTLIGLKAGDENKKQEQKARNEKREKDVRRKRLEIKT
jgi:hypothetical protein